MVADAGNELSHPGDCCAVADFVNLEVLRNEPTRNNDAGHRTFCCSRDRNAEQQSDADNNIGSRFIVSFADVRVAKRELRHFLNCLGEQQHGQI